MQDRTPAETAALERLGIPTETDAYRFTLEQHVLGSMTRLPADRARVVIACRAARTPEERAWVLRTAMRKRADNLAWVTRVQREWQSKTRRPNRARHHDSIAIRESYVRC